MVKLGFFSATVISQDAQRPTCAPLERRKCRVANIFWNNCSDWRHHKSLVLATLATSYSTNGLVSAHSRLSASHSTSQPAHLTSWPITTFKIYKENTAMSNPGLGRETSPWFSQHVTLQEPNGSHFFFPFDSQGKPDRDHVSESSSPLQHQSCGILTASPSPSPGNVLLCDH